MALYDILPTPYGGRGAFARQRIPKGTLLLSCSAPYAHVIYWEFRREVCAWCFAYAFESGKSKWSLKLSDDNHIGGNGGVWFCSENCRDLYICEHEIFEGHGPRSRTEISILVEKLLSQNGRQKNGVVVSPATPSELDSISRDNITPEFIDRAWASNNERKSRAEELTDGELDTARYALDGLLRKVNEQMNPSATVLDRLPDSKFGYSVSAGRWADFMELQDNELPYIQSSPQKLSSNIRVYRFLQHITSMLPKTHRSLNETSCQVVEKLKQCLATPEDTRALLARDPGNIFGIWDMATDEGSEMLGWGAFVFASYFNHSCEPNIQKTRNKRGVDFYALKDIAAGEEICISYSDGVSVEDRMRKLQSGWFFVCHCARCVKDLEIASKRPTS